MRIVNLETFKALPEGTLFMKYEPCIFDDLQAKGYSDEYDFGSANITSWIDCVSSGDMEDKLFDAQELSVSLDMDFDSYGRDGCFEENQLFAVYEKKDVEMLIDKLSRCLKEAY